MKYICECCGEEKEDWPAIAYNSLLQFMIFLNNKINKASNK